LLDVALREEQRPTLAVTEIVLERRGCFVAEESEAIFITLAAANEQAPGLKVHVLYV
jgi:hypothetical protein